MNKVPFVFVLFNREFRLYRALHTTLEMFSPFYFLNMSTCLILLHCNKSLYNKMARKQTYMYIKLEDTNLKLSINIASASLCYNVNEIRNILK